MKLLEIIKQIGVILLINLNEIFKDRDINIEKLKKYGFILDEDEYVYRKNILNNTFSLIVKIKDVVDYTVIDLENDEEYMPLKISSVVGEYVSNVRNACKEILEDISYKCYENKYFKNNITSKVIEYIKNKYDVDLEYAFKDNNLGVFRRKDNEKWFGILIALNGNKVDVSINKEVELINLKAKAEDVIKLIEKDGIYRAYHMNKKYWISCILDEKINIDEIFKLIDNSFELTGK
ncbi:MmcQ/YjbR family DNA-binding protein [Pseudostreptobacillus hongkongensis]|uniref:MmcQ/YjbR family DNA-binding protein n=1 Tax=Pseudostreptobacillus hongkongensis TaxID=1162717 RepID=UPI0028D7F9A6|nr:MmcQ/YjbR family DNA-binding protein [Pseudostreptobacillus hongkongensis]